jgi:hypothetical protein
MFTCLVCDTLANFYNKLFSKTSTFAPVLVVITFLTLHNMMNLNMCLQYTCRYLENEISDQGLRLSAAQATVSSNNSDLVLSHVSTQFTKLCCIVASMIFSNV